MHREEGSSEQEKKRRTCREGGREGSKREGVKTRDDAHRTETIHGGKSAERKDAWSTIWKETRCIQVHLKTEGLLDNRQKARRKPGDANKGCEYERRWASVCLPCPTDRAHTEQCGRSALVWSHCGAQCRA